MLTRARSKRASHEGDGEGAASAAAPSQQAGARAPPVVAFRSPRVDDDHCSDHDVHDMDLSEIDSDDEVEIQLHDADDGVRTERTPQQAPPVRAEPASMAHDSVAVGRKGGLRTGREDADPRLTRKTERKTRPLPHWDDVQANTRAVKWIKPDKFSASISIEAYLSHFDVIAEYNSWTERDKAAHLKASLTGDAAQVLWDGGDHAEMTYDKAEG
jgi:hypothetical protein